jgi:Uma2 family endonuclease
VTATAREEAIVPQLNHMPLTEQDYVRAEQEYLRNLPLEHFMEATPQGTQRKIVLESLDLLRARRPDVQVFNELLVQAQVRGRLVQVVPDNMVVLSNRQIRAVGSFNLPFEPARPFWVLEYVSSHSERKDYEDSFNKYERDLRVPYCLLFHPERQDLQVYRHGGRRYKALKPNAAGRYAIPELDLEVGLLDGWVRFWYQGELLELPAELQQQLDTLKQRADQEKQRADQQKRRADREKQRADQQKRRADKEKERRLAAEAEVERLRALMERSQREQQE